MRDSQFIRIVASIKRRVRLAPVVLGLSASWVLLVPAPAEGQNAGPPFIPTIFEEHDRDGETVFVARRGALVLTVSPQGFALDLMQRVAPPQGSLGSIERAREGDSQFHACRVSFEWEGALSHCRVEGQGTPGFSDRAILDSRGTTVAPTYSSVRVSSVYPGVDIEVYDTENYLEYDWVLSPGSKVDDLTLRCVGAMSLAVEEDGSLSVKTPLGLLRQTPPRTYGVNRQGMRTPLVARYRLIDESRIGFEVDGVSPEDQVVIDPGFLYGSFHGGKGVDLAYAMARGDDGSLYIVGETFSPIFPETGHRARVEGSAIPSPIRRVASDAFISKLDPVQGEIVYSIILGGSGEDRFFDVHVDAQGKVYACGATGSPDFPTTPDAVDKTLGGDFDAIVVEIDPSGRSLVYSTYLGGDDPDQAFALEVSDSGEVYVTGDTDSDDFPTVNAYDRRHNGGTHDIFVTKFTANGNLDYSTFVGGDRDDTSFVIRLQPNGQAWVGGRSYSSDFPTTSNGYDRSRASGWDPVIFSLSPSGGSLRYGTFFGGDCRDEVHAMEIRGSDVYFSGVTAADDFPLSANAPDTHNITQTYDSFAAKIHITDNDTDLIYSTYIGSDGHDVGWGIAVADDGTATIVGTSYNPNFPMTACADDTVFEGISEVFMTQVDPTGSEYTYSTYVGGHSGDEGNDVVLSGTGSVWLSGVTYSFDFPTTSDALDGSFSGNGDAYILEVAPTEQDRVTLVDLDFEEANGWTVQDSDLDTGSWERGVPIDNGRGDPDQDYDGSGQCWITGNDVDEDVDGGPTVLTSPQYDLTGYESIYVSYARWIDCDDEEDDLIVEITHDDGGSWTTIEAESGNGGWELREFQVENYIALTDRFRVRFTVSDNPNDSITEAAVDRFQIVAEQCPLTLTGDPGLVEEDRFLRLSVNRGLPGATCLFLAHVSGDAMGIPIPIDSATVDSRGIGQIRIQVDRSTLDALPGLWFSAIAMDSRGRVEETNPVSVRFTR